MLVSSALLHIGELNVVFHKTSRVGLLERRRLRVELTASAIMGFQSRKPGKRVFLVPLKEITSVELGKSVKHKYTFDFAFQFLVPTFL